MTSPTTQIIQMTYRNPHASMPMLIPVAVVCNTSDEDLERNIRANSALPLKWIAAEEPHKSVALMCGGGPSLADHLDDIRAFIAEGGITFAMNGAAKYLREHGIKAHFQVIADAKPETAQLVDPHGPIHLFASQVHPDTVARAQRPHVWHLEIGEIERWFPEERLKRGGYALIGGGAAVGNAALCLAYAMGYRTMHVFGYDSSHRGEESHAYAQPMNRFTPCVDAEWAGKIYLSSVAMKAQAEKFQITAQGLKQHGCAIMVHGDGLLPAMYNTPVANLAERDKYRLMWQFDGYRDFSPGENAVQKFIEIASPEGKIIDFGCGTGRAALALGALGHDVILVDFADNCRDEEALSLPFLEWDLTCPCPLRAPYGFCADVMEHIPTDDVPTVVRNIMGSAKRVFFQICTVPDSFGAVIGEPLHHTVKPHAWWRDVFLSAGFAVEWQQDSATTSSFYVSRQQETH